MNRTRIGVITTSYPRTPDDPAGGFVGGHVRALRTLGHTVEVIGAGDGERTPELHRIAGGDSFYTGGAPDRLERAPLRSLVAATSFTARLTARVTAHARRWDSIIAHWLVPSAIAALATSRPLLAIAHGGDVHTLRRLHLLAPVLTALRARRARLVFVSHELRAIARAAAPGLASWLERAIVQPMGIDVERFARLTRAPSRPATILIAARLVPVKGVDVAVAAMPHLATAARLVIAGDGPERERLEHGGAANIRFLGAVDTTRRDQLLREASVVVIPSRVLASGRSEGTPMIALEALAAGVPVVASAVGGLRELARLELVPADDPRRLATAIDRVLAAPPDPGGLRHAVAELAWDRVAPRLLEALCE